MSKKKPKYQFFFHYKAPLYGVGMSVITSLEEAKDIGFEIHDNHGACVFIGETDAGISNVVALFRPDHLTPNTMAHEATHAAWRILDLVGTKVTSKNHESLAYLVGWVMDCFTEAATRTTELLTPPDNAESPKE